MITALHLRLTAITAALAIFSSAYAETLLTASPWNHATIHSAVGPAKILGAVRIDHKNTMTSGGFSALWISPDCDYLITISDYSQAQPWDKTITRSGWIQARIEYDQTGNLIGVTKTGSGQVVNSKGDVISGAIEAMAWDGTGFLVSFDNRGEIYHYSGTSPAGSILSNPPQIAFQGPNLAQDNKGMESLTVLPDGRILALWEKEDGASTATAWLIESETSLSVPYHATLNPGGATTLSDGSVVIVERKFLGREFGTRVRLVQLARDEVQGPTTSLNGKVLFDATSRLLDNFEGVGACQKGQREIVFAISDNNGDWPRALRGKNPQVTLLLIFGVGN